MVSAILSDQVGPLGATLKMFIKMSDFKAGLGWKAGVGQFDELCVAATLFFWKKELRAIATEREFELPNYPSVAMTCSISKS